MVSSDHTWEVAVQFISPLSHSNHFDSVQIRLAIAHKLEGSH